MRGYERRKIGTRRQFNFILIVCEGKRAEPLYFESFNERYNRIIIIPPHSGATDPRSLVEYALEKMREYQVRKGDGNEVWCVFDVDENRDEVLRNTIEHAMAKGVNVALSNPSFELWYLLHFIMRDVTISRQEVCDELNLNYIPGYDKGRCYGSILEPMIRTASTNAQRLNELHRKMGHDLRLRESNPSTQIFLLIRSIREMKERNMNSKLKNNYY